MIELFLGVAVAQTPEDAPPACEALSPDDVTGISQFAQEALKGGDILGYGASWRVLRERLPCLNGPVPRNDWGAFLGGLATVQYELGQDWKAPLDTALQINPSLPRESMAAPLKAWPGTPADATPGAMLAADTRYFVDGQEVHSAPNLRGLHLVQRAVGDRWETLVLEGEPFPATWTPAAAPVEPPPPPELSPTTPKSAWGIGASLSGGYASRTQTVDASAEWIGDGRVQGAAVTLTVDGDGERNGWGAWCQAGIPVHSANGWADPTNAAWLGVRRFFGPVHVDVGGGALVTRIDTATEPVPFVLVAPRVGLGTRPLVAGPIDVQPRLEFAWTPAVTDAEARVAVGLGHGVLRPTIGAEGAWRSAHFRQTDDRGADASDWRVGVSVGLRGQFTVQRSISLLQAIVTDDPSTTLTGADNSTGAASPNAALIR